MPLKSAYTVYFSSIAYAFFDLKKKYSTHKHPHMFSVMLILLKNQGTIQLFRHPCFGTM